MRSLQALKNIKSRRRYFTPFGCERLAMTWFLESTVIILFYRTWSNVSIHPLISCAPPFKAIRETLTHRANAAMLHADLQSCEPSCMKSRVLIPYVFLSE